MAIRTYARGNKAWGECGRCGRRALLKTLVFDGRYPNLRVHPECRDTLHPLEDVPYAKVEDPIALWKPTTDLTGQGPVVFFLPLYDVASDSRLGQYVEVESIGDVTVVVT
jgi:hypothetical protein